MSSGGVVIEPAGPPHAQYFVQTWVPFHLIRLITDATWIYRPFPWDRIIVAGGSVGITTVLAATVGKDTEGLLALERVRGASQLKVRFLSTAPWNFGAQKQRSGIGSGLLAYAVQLSKIDGYAGCTLSSTPESEKFYERLDWKHTGQRDHEGLKIYELTADRADGFLAKHPPFAMKK